MAQSTSIEWTDSTWNPVTGCSKISSGCENCYAERIALRLKAMGNPSYINGFTVTLHEELLNLPLKWKKPHIIFVNSMSDLFHENIPEEFIMRVFNVMHKANWHHYQILTKRSKRMLEISSKLHWMPHIWMGVTVEKQEYLYRVEHLQKTNSNIKFLSLEPLLGPINDIPLFGIDWVIVGGESGPKSRKMKKHWVLGIRDQCQDKKVPFFFKQWGGINKKKAGRVLEGRTWDEKPTLLTRPQLI